MLHFNFSQKVYPAIATENIICGNLIDKSSRQGITSIGSQHNEQLSLTRTSTEDNCEKLQAKFVISPTDDAYCEATENCEKTVAKANAEGLPELSKEEKLTAPAKFGENVFTRIWEECAIDEADKKENEDSNVAATVGGSGDTKQEGGIVFGTLRQQLVAATVKLVENQSYDAETVVPDETVFDNVFERSTAEELVMFNAFVEGQDRNGVRLRNVVCSLVQMKLEGPGNSEGKILLKDGNKITAGRVQESRLDNDVKDWPLGSGRKKKQFVKLGASITPLRREKLGTVQSAFEQSLLLRQSNVSTAKEVFPRKSSTTESDTEVLHVHMLELGDDKSLTPPKASDLALKIPIDGGNASPFDIGENVVAVHCTLREFLFNAR